MRTNKTNRKGTILPLLAISLIALFGMAALAVDVGMLGLTKNQCQLTADAAALAGARTLNGLANEDHNRAGVGPTVKNLRVKVKILNDEIAEGNLTTRIGYYSYDNNKGKFTAEFPANGNKPNNEAWSSVEATVRANVSSYFSKIFENTGSTIVAKATAVHNPRDIAIVLDYSGSMRFNSLNGYPFFGNIEGSMNPDPAFPQFGPWSVISDVMMKNTPHFVDGGDVQAPTNMTIETDDGPPIVKDFQTLDNRMGGVYSNAFHRDFAGEYDWRTRGDKFAIPTPERFGKQDTFSDYSGSPISLAGDPWPRKNGFLNPGFVDPATGLVREFAATVQEYLTGSNTLLANNHAKNVAFERDGYPNFQGYTLGPGYYGKTFYLWPPDPRQGKDFRSKFFKVSSGADAIGQGNGIELTSNASLFNSNTSNFLFGPIGSHIPASSGLNRINYNAVLNWIKSGPQVFPPNLRAGRVLYYSEIPSSMPDQGGNPDERFWRAYIDYVMGASFFKGRWLYGTHFTPWGTSKITSRSSLNSTSSLRPYIHYNDNPIPPRLNFWFGPLSMLDFLSNYQTGRNWLPGTCHESATWQLKAGVQSTMDYLEKNHPNDQAALIYFSSIDEYKVSRVRMSKDFTKMKNALFFPKSLLDNLENPNMEVRPFKADFNNTYLGINNAFLLPDGDFFPSEFYLNDAAAGEIPNAMNGTCPDMGFMVAYNEFSSFGGGGGEGGFNGRQGATKLVIFESDGRPTSSAIGNFVAQKPFHHRFNQINNVDSSQINHSEKALDTLQTLCNLANRIDTAGYATTKSPVRVHALAFGYLFEPTTSSDASQEAMNFLVEAQRIGGTQPAGTNRLEEFKIITGNFNTRIKNLQTAFERILQSGVQIRLIE